MCTIALLDLDVDTLLDEAMTPLDEDPAVRRAKKKEDMREVRAIKCALSRVGEWRRLGPTLTRTSHRASG